jgi:hypothetical protein
LGGEGSFIRWPPSKARAYCFAKNDGLYWGWKFAQLLSKHLEKI